MYLKLYGLFWAILAISLAALAVYRMITVRGKYTMLHLPDSERGLMPQETAFTHRLDHIDRCGKMLTIAIILYTASLPVAFLIYMAWQAWLKR
jgi:hypothetical protein